MITRENIEKSESYCNLDKNTKSIYNKSVTMNRIVYLCNLALNLGIEEVFRSQNPNGIEKTIIKEIVNSNIDDIEVIEWNSI